MEDNGKPQRWQDESLYVNTQPISVRIVLVLVYILQHKASVVESKCCEKYAWLQCLFFFFQKILLFLLLENKMQNINHQCEAAWPPRSLVQMFWAPCASCHGPRSEEEDGEGLGHDPTARRLWVRKWRTTRWVTSKGSCNPVYTETPTWHAGNYFGDPTSLHGLHNVPGAIRHHGGRAWEQHNISTLYSFGVDKFLSPDLVVISIFCILIILSHWHINLYSVQKWQIMYCIFGLNMQTRWGLNNAASLLWQIQNRKCVFCK